MWAKALVLVLSLALSFVPAVAAPKRTWLEASSQHFVIYSSEDEETLRKFASRLERYDAAMRYLRDLDDPDLGPANRLVVYVVANATTVQKILGAKGSSILGVYSPHASGSFAIVPRRLWTGGLWEIDPETVLLHEYAHHFLYQNYGGAYPGWFTEGYAEFHSTARFEEDGSVKLGWPAAHRSYGLTSNIPMPIETLLTASGNEMGREKVDVFYARAWLLTHYLTFEPKRAGQLSAYLAALNNSQSGLDAARSAFGDLDVLGRDLNTYLRRRTMTFLSIAGTAIKQPNITIRKLTQGESAIIDLKIRVRKNAGKDQAVALLPEVQRAAAPFPKHPIVQATLAQAEFQAGNYAAAEAAADRALAAAPQMTDALLYKARVRMEMAATSSADDAKAWKEIRQWLITANRIDPNDPEPLILFYKSFLREGVAPTANAIVGLNRAYQLAPQDSDLRFTVARQYLLDGKATDARAALAPLILDPHAGDTSKKAAAIVAGIDATGTVGGLSAWSDSPQ
jgi:tetratricopeptide (TPR) repeat protein